MWFRSKNPPRLTLALQGGGAHGAFTWGVLDALLEDGTIDIEGVSATSAGAMNAAVLAQGLLRNGRDGAREALERFWEAVAACRPFETSLGVDNETGRLSPGVRMFMSWTRHFSPKLLNPFDVNPLREVLTAQLDFERLRVACPIKLFVAATHVNSGRLRLFRETEMSAEALLASACLPSLHRPVEIDGEYYWDGAYSANPAVFPLFYECDADDLMLVLLSPTVYGPTPHTPDEVRGRSLDLAFNAAFLREMDAFSRCREQALRDWLPLGRLERRLLRARFHLIEAEALTSRLATESRLTISLSFLQLLRDRGRAEAQAWLGAHRDDLGRRSSTDIARRFR